MRSHPTRLRRAKAAGEGQFSFIVLLFALFIGGLLLFWLNTLFFGKRATSPSHDDIAPYSEIISDTSQEPGTVPPPADRVPRPTPVAKRPDSAGSLSPRDNTEALVRRRRVETEVQEEDKLAAHVVTEPGPVEAETKEADPESEDTTIDDQMSSDELRSLSGWVFDQSGGPVPDLRVIARARRVMAESESAAIVGGGHEQQTASNGDGYFVFQQLVDGEYDVRTEDTERYEAARALLRAGVDSAVLVVKEKLNLSVNVHGTVESTNGGFLDGVRVVPIGQAGQGVHTNELGDYRFNLAVKGHRNNYAIRFIREGYRSQRLTLAAEDIRDVDEVLLNALLEPVENLAPVVGTVTGTDGSPVHLARVQLYSARLKRSYQTGSDRTGRFSFPAVEVATDYRLWIRPKDRYKDYIDEGLVITSGKLDLTIVLEPLGLASLSGRMLDPDGGPVPGFSLWLRTTYATAQRFMLVTSDHEGRFFVGELPEGELMLQTRSSPLLTITGIALSPGATKNVRLTLDTGSHTLDGYVQNAQDDPVPGARISLLWSYEDEGVHSRSTRKTLADANGYFLFTQLGSGLHTLNISASGFRGALVEHQVGADAMEVLVKLIDELSP